MQRYLPFFIFIFYFFIGPLTTSDETHTNSKKTIDLS